MFVWEDRKHTDRSIVWCLLWKWSGRRCQSTGCRMCLCGQGYFLVVFWDLVLVSTILLTVIVSLASLLYCCIILRIFLHHMILCSRRGIKSWWRLKSCGPGWVKRVPTWLSWGAMGDLSFLCVYISVSFHMVNVLLGAWLLAECFWVVLLVE